MSLSDLELMRIAKRISDISELGLLLKFEATEVDTFEEENEKDMMVKKGTKNMLKQWNKREDSTKEKLVEALRLSDMENLAQEVERGILTEQHKIFMQQDEQPSNTVTTDEVSDETLEMLAKHVQPEHYLRLTFELGTEYNQASGILEQHNINYRKAILECLHMWKTRTGGSLTELKRILLKRKLDDLVKYLEQGDERYSTGTSREFDRPIPQLLVKDDFDDILKTVARKVVTNNEIDGLAGALGYNVGSRRSYTATSQSLFWTLLRMLREWRNKQTKTQERSALISALKASGNIHLAVELFEEDEGLRDQLSEVDDQDPFAVNKERQIILEEGRIVITIPAGEPKDGQKITVETVPVNATDLALKDNEAVISLGLKFSPPGITFDDPIKITMPHCAVFTRTEEAKIVLYNRGDDGKIRRVSPSSKGTPRCVIRETDLDLYIDHFCFWYVVSLIEGAFIGKRLMCTPYIPLSSPRNSQHCVNLHLKDYYRTTKDSIPGFKIADEGQMLIIWWGYGDLLVKYIESGKERTSKKRGEAAFHHNVSHRIPFALVSHGTKEKEVLIEMNLKQRTELDVMFVFKFDDDNEVDVSEAVERGMVTCNRSRIMVVGPAGVGKTCFICRLTSQGFRPDEPSTIGTVNTSVTSGWKIEDRIRDATAESLFRYQEGAKNNKNSDVYPTSSATSGTTVAEQNAMSPLGASTTQPETTGAQSESAGAYPTTEGSESNVRPHKMASGRIHSVNSTANDVTYSIWDFGGQEIYYITHPVRLPLKHDLKKNNTNQGWQIELTI